MRLVSVYLKPMVASIVVSSKFTFAPFWNHVKWLSALIFSLGLFAQLLPSQFQLLSICWVHLFEVQVKRLLWLLQFFIFSHSLWYRLKIIAECPYFNTRDTCGLFFADSTWKIWAPFRRISFQNVSSSWFSAKQKRKKLGMLTAKTGIWKLVHLSIALQHCAPTIWSIMIANCFQRITQKFKNFMIVKSLPKSSTLNKCCFHSPLSAKHWAIRRLSIK